jgi:hypothetical protein
VRFSRLRAPRFVFIFGMAPIPFAPVA